MRHDTGTWELIIMTVAYLAFMGMIAFAFLVALPLAGLTLGAALGVRVP